MKKILSLLLSLTLICSVLAGCTNDSKATVSTQSISSDDAGLTLHFIDVGQGDCTLIESKGSFALIDAGEYSEHEKVISYLSAQGVESLDFIISTHPHSDHCGGLSEVVRNFDTATFICPNANSDTSSWEYVLDAVDERGVQCENPELYDTYQLGGATLTILSPSSESVYSDLNNYSIVCMLEYGNTSVLLTGDAEKLVERELVSGTYDLSADVLKCGHHGSSTSSCSEFLDAVDPSAAIISCGKDNDYGHPHDEVLEALENRSIPIWRTDEMGNIIVASDGEQIYISTQNSDSEVLVTDSTATKNETSAYIGNKNSKVFHLSTCRSVSTMKEDNKVEFDSWEEATEAGYKACGSCNP